MWRRCVSGSGRHFNESQQRGSPIEISPSTRYRMSTFYEQLVEHVFIAELLQDAWFGFHKVVEVLRSEIDAAGYDLVLECDGVIRHVQLKTSTVGGRTAQQNVNIALAEKPSGCVLWIVRDEDHQTNRMRLTYRFFGGAPGEPLPSLDGFRVGRHTKGNAEGLKAERPSIRVISKGQFVAVRTTQELLGVLFGVGESPS